MPLSMTPGSSIIASPELRCRHGLRRDLSSSALPILPAIRFTRGKYFGASRFTHLLRPAKLLAPLYGSDRYARPSRAFTSRLPTDRLPSPLLDMTTTATGLLCWRDFHPLEWQLASLHQTLAWRVALPLLPLQKFAKKLFTLLGRKICRRGTLQEGGKLAVRELSINLILLANTTQHLIRDAPACPTGNRRCQIYISPFRMTRRI